MLVHATSIIIVVGVFGALSGVAQAGPTEALLQAGSYEVEVRLVLPNAESSAADKTTTICVPNAQEASGAPLPVLSDNNPLAKCPVEDVQRNGATLSFDIVCDGRNAAKGRAVYTLMPRRFEGRIAMVMGGKNMTMTEVQAGRRVGSCAVAGAPQN
ncbi:MAG: DUF3617 domain-containing protein [Geminicoccales bacterium]